MTGRAIRALCVAGALAFPAGGALAADHVRPVDQLDLTAYSTIVDRDAPARARLAGQFDLGFPAPFRQLDFGPPDPRQTDLVDSTAHLVLFDGVSLDVGAGADLAGRFDAFDAAGTGAYDGLFFSASAVNSPYVTLANGGSFAALNFDVSKSLRLSLGAASLAPGMGFDWASPGSALARLGGAPEPYDSRSANSLLAGVSWNFAPWGGIGLTASQTSERNGALGDFDPMLPSSSTSALGVSAGVQLGDGWTTTASFAQAITKLDLRPGIGPENENARTRSYGFAVAKRGLFGNDAMGLAITRPAGEGDNFALVSGADALPQFSDVARTLDSRTPETDFELGYVTTFLDGSVALQTNAAYQMNFAGQNGANAVSLLSRAKIKF
ncbi:MAG TPA: hypothetical protein VHC42_04635 [Rhizomicrobium sp.]|nr:hypothetical protein [Rhizomicrobium sp.]